MAKRISRLEAPEINPPAVVPERELTAERTTIEGQRSELAHVLDPSGSEQSETYAQTLAPYRTLFSPNDEIERPMYNAMNHLCDMLESDPECATLWQKAMGHVEEFHGSYVDPFILISGDQLRLESLTGNGTNLDRWITFSEQAVRESLTSSTFAELGSSMNVDRLMKNAKREGTMRPIVELARHFRSVAIGKRWHKCSKEIRDEREKRLRAKLSLTPYEPILPRHRFEVPYYTHITLDQMKAYMSGDRSEYVFTVDGVTNEDNTTGSSGERALENDEQ